MNTAARTLVLPAMEHGRSENRRGARSYSGLRFDAALLRRTNLAAEFNRDLPPLPRRHSAVDPGAIIRTAFAAIGRGDVERLLELYDRDIEFLPLTGTRVETGGYHGHEG